jgi:hypothetical protein
LVEKFVSGGDVDEIFVSYWARFTSGYLFRWPSGTTCASSGGNASKEFIIFRSGANADGRITLGQNTQSAQTVDLGRSDLFDLRWDFTINGEPGSRLPATEGKGYYRQYLADGGGVDLRPARLGDGQWHRVTWRIRRETSVDAGDGVIQLWVDGQLLMDYVGSDPSNPAYRQVHTRTMPFRIIQYQTVLNRGAPQAQSRWYDDVTIWRRP